MNTIIILAAAVICVSLVSIFAFKAIKIQQRTIDRLSDKLLARDYKEYASMQPKQQEDRPAAPKKKPLSWFDTSSDEDEVQ